MNHKSSFHQYTHARKKTQLDPNFGFIDVSIVEITKSRVRITQLRDCFSKNLPEERDLEYDQDEVNR